MASTDTDRIANYCEARTIEGLASALDIAIMIYDRNDTLIAASSQFLRFFKVSPHLLVPGARLRDLFNETYDAGASVLGSLNGRARNISREDWVAERIAVHWRERYESIERLADGRWIRLVKRRMPDGVLIATIQDISEQKRRDAELAQIRHKAELAQHILDNLVTPVIVKDSDLRYVIVNDAFCRIPGLHPRQVLGRTAKDLVARELAERFERIEKHVLETGEPFDAVEDIYRADGTIMHAITRARRSGMPGNYYVTVSFDDIGAFIEAGDNQATITSRYDLEMTVDEARARAARGLATPKKPSGRILVLDEDGCRGSERTKELKARGYDAIAISDSAEALAFLKTIRSIGLDLNDVEMTVGMAKALAGIAGAQVPAVFTEALARMLADSAPAKIPSSVVAFPGGQPQDLPPAEPASDAEPPSPAPAPASPPESAEAPAAARSRRIRVLVAEDNEVNQIVFEQILEAMGVDYRIASNGEKAVEAWRAAAPDLILMDVSMPVMNGLQATQAIRDSEASVGGDVAHVPIIAVTAHAMTGDRDRCFSAGMDDYLSKPVSPEKLEMIIRKWIDCSDRFLAAE